ncbi:hypothetical protein IGI37_002115 [Enterococcus sp. AZ194]|uniref:site-specific integrase n=1 Tax=Enterococcus sp. AZ194 TaxID=2774629 RepID=UPI003F22C2FE
MATFKQYEKKNGTRAWMFTAYSGVINGKQKNVTRRGFKTQKEAKNAYARLELGLDEEKIRLVEEKKTYQDIYDLWIVEYTQTVKESTLLKTERLFKNHILPAFSTLYIDEIKPLDVQEQMTAWHKKLAGANTVMNYAGLVFDYAMRMQIITINPTKIIKKPVRKKKVKNDDDLNFYDKPELKEFMAAAEKSINFRAYVFFRLLAFTGMRTGESLALNWLDIDFESKTLNITKAVSRKETGLYIQPPKNPSSIRRISLDDKTLDILQEFKSDIENEDDLIFMSDKRGILSTSKPRKWMLAIQDKVDENRKKPMKRISVHGFRHTHASLLFEAGATIKDVQARLGHSDIQTTMDVYTHVSKHAKEQLATKFNNYVDF